MRRLLYSECYKWYPVDYKGATGGTIHDSYINYDETRKIVYNWIDQHIRPENNLFTCPITVNIIRHEYEEGKRFPYITKAEMANALWNKGYQPVGSFSNGWYYEVKVI